jgi:copper chaperone CopZ
VKSLEHRLKLSERSEASQSQRIASLEEMVQTKEKELLEALEHARTQEEERAQRFDEDYSSVSAQHRLLQEKFAALSHEHAALRRAVDENEVSTAAEIETLTHKMHMQEKELVRATGRCEECEYEVRTLKTALHEREHLYAQANTKVTLLLEEARVTKETHQSTLQELTSEIRERTESLKSRDAQVAQLRTTVGQLESDFIHRDEEIASKLLRRVAADEENRQLRLQSDAQLADMALLRTRIEDLQVKLSDMAQQNEVLKELSDQQKFDLESTIKKLTERVEETRYLYFLNIFRSML